MLGLNCLEMQNSTLLRGNMPTKIYRYMQNIRCNYEIMNIQQSSATINKRFLLLVSVGCCAVAIVVDSS